jgi:AraC-like DNA-binding protein
MYGQPQFPRGLSLFSPPYHACIPIAPRPGVAASPGSSLVWYMTPSPDVERELEAVRHRPPALPLFVVLPEPEEIVALTHLLRAVPGLRPRGVLPSAGQGVIPALRTLLTTPPPALPRAVVAQLEASGVLRDPEARETVETIFAAAPRITSIQKLATAMCQSRRTLGRFFHRRQLPVPSHWLQFARVLHVSIQLQNTRTNVNRVAARYGYADGFTLSNSMKRLTGYRPTFIRQHLGWEWIVDVWLRREGF